MTKKLARIEPHSSLRRLVTFASTTMPAMSKRITSPSFRPRVLAMPCSTEASDTPGASVYQVPPTISLPSGACAIVDRLNSRFARRCASSLV